MALQQSKFPSFQQNLGPFTAFVCSIASVCILLSFDVQQ